MKRLASICLSFVMFLILLPAFSFQKAAAADYSEAAVRSAMLAVKAQYPDGTPFDNSVFKTWNGGIFGGGFGCAGFAFMVSDAAFGNLPARKYYDYTKVRVGDILRINNDSHSVIVLYVNSDSFTVAEGNLNGKVYWGRVLPKSDIMNGTTTYAMTRYPENASAAKGDVNSDASISADDAQLVLQEYVRSISGRPLRLTQAQTALADVNGNSKADLEDAQFILRFYVLNSIAHRNISWAELMRR